MCCECMPQSEPYNRMSSSSQIRAAKAKAKRLFTLSFFPPVPCSIVRSFERIVSIFAQQLEVGDRISFMTENILFVAELVSWVAC